MSFACRIVTAVCIGLLCVLPLRIQQDSSMIPVPEPVSVRLLFAGDIMQHMPQITAARKGNRFDYSPVFAAVHSRFECADWVVVNLETTLTRSDDYAGYPRFRSPVALAEALRDAGVAVAVMANNQCCDGGAVGIATPAEVLD
ncbi:MAG: CapA family protein, partial [Alistipes sp.]|nr:CapA family protein [Alistipes sp.]